ncbi:hypothetical protein BCR34DRAFT_553031 [Clohesyomyces aquaticus]|uniref:Uncharacterized protein n=1 Tax=Clohesyomyces aquaticus TaxID=1231657 RepID=A0A1Y2A8W9_9PLEO|nr:hypothetical protein BCR34DRAFT_553031 [Clohesyomyces aquaticus]
MDNLHDQRPETTLPYQFDTGFTEELQIAYPIQIRLPASVSVTGVPLGNSGSKPTLTTGAIIGIAFGGFFSLFITCLITYLVLRSRKRKQTEVPPTATNPGGPSDMAELSYRPAEPRGLNSLPRKPVPQQFWESQGVPFELPPTTPYEVSELPEISR